MFIPLGQREESLEGSCLNKKAEAVRTDKIARPAAYKKHSLNIKTPVNGE